ncbi:MAG: phytoene/squalene synthase family protein [Bacteroidetes bacterium]|nr:phytoene/squalene synthase family protein [Bacteroidota bacterium]
MMHLFHRVSQRCSQITTEEYSTSFASAIRLLHRDLRSPVYSIYGMVRLADEIVDTFHEQDKQQLLTELKAETFNGILRGLSLNPVLHSFQLTVRKYRIDEDLIEAFFHSMEMDLCRDRHTGTSYKEYIYGSAEVVGLMCLQVFCEGNAALYDRLLPYARSLGAAFQKVNFLRDLHSDYHNLNRTYFPDMEFDNFTPAIKREIEEDIEKDFRHAAIGVEQLPVKARFGVYVAYKYYFSLFNKIRNLEPAGVLRKRVRVPNYQKLMILLGASLKNRFNLI